MGSRLRRVRSLDDLPSERALAALVKRAAALNDGGLEHPDRARVDAEGEGRNWKYERKASAR